jgi:hypothetical protein
MSSEDLIRHAKALAEFPAPLRELIEAELRAGNEITAIGSGQPAPMCGARVRLARPVTTRPRANSEGMKFFERCGSSHSGEFCDAERTFFVLEPPKEYTPPDMDAIREGLNARERAANADRSASGMW